MAKKSVADYPHLQALMDRPIGKFADSTVLDNGMVHYGSNMPGSLCGVHGPRQESPHWVKVTCPGCKGEARRRIPKTPAAPPTRWSV